MKKIEIVEVGPRDGFQNVNHFIETERKKAIINRIAASGVNHIQVTSFVNPKAIPQMKDAQEVSAYCFEKYPEKTLTALVPNKRGAENAIASGFKELSFVISVSQSHNLNNVRKTPEDSFQELVEIMEENPEIKVHLDVATAFGCPFEGVINKETVLTFIDNAYIVGVRHFVLCDTIGIATPDRVEVIVKACLERFPDCEFQIHIHDTRNMGITNTLMAIHCGITKVQTSLGGLGGCPFAPGASGNTSTEDLVYVLNEMGFETEVDFEKILKAAKYTKEHVQGNYSGHQILIKNT